ncbi:MAG: hypothetical protein J0L80_10305 [Chitinophagales bacterium]|nr:hypothetical protein [Chitinophagales bacterium]
MRLFLSILFVAFTQIANAQSTYIIVLGTVQDGGYPHLGCKKQCCEKAWKNTTVKQHIVSLALVDSQSHKWWLFEATPDIREQLQLFKALTKGKYNYLPDGIFLTHAHIGHYTGLMQLGREVMGTKDVQVYAMPKMKTYLETNGPWSQLVSLHNIVINLLNNEANVIPASGISITPFIVPHRDEYSETVGYRINTTSTSYLFIPDIDKWQKWDKDIITEVKQVDYAFVDATFLSDAELPGRRMDEVPHPFVKETMTLFSNQPDDIKRKIHFIHINHTNPLLWSKPIQDSIRKLHYNIAIQGKAY